MRWFDADNLAEESQSKDSRKLKIQVQGLFEPGYSFAKTNRFLSEAMYKTGIVDVSIHCTGGNGNYLPKEEDLRDKPLLRYLREREESFGTPDVALRNCFPLVTTGLTAQLNFQFFAWEEDHVPQEFIEWFNNNLDGIGTTSDFVTNALKDSGIKIPVKTMGFGACLPENYEDIKPYPLNTRKTVRFLCIVPVFPRNNVDVLLETYFDAFTAQDDVCLILKTFPGANNMAEQLEKLRKKYPNGPEVEHIAMDLPEDLLYGLYKATSCYVHCPCGEWGGLPVAEAMLARVPVIVCNNSGSADFCREDTCLTVGYTTVKTRGYVPDRDHLKQRMIDFVFHASDWGITEKVEAAYQLISNEFTWNATAKRWLDFIHEVCENKVRPTVDMVTSWNIKCGVAEFSRYFVEASDLLADYRIFPDRGQTLVRQDEAFVHERVWHQQWFQEVFQDNDLEQLVNALKASPSEVLHIQYHTAFFPLYILAKMCMELRYQKKIIILFHTTGYIQEESQQYREDTIRGLNTAYRILVHQQVDVDRLAAFGINPAIIKIIPLGQMTFPYRSVEQARNVLGIHSNHVIGTYGFLLPHKGIRKTIRAVALLKKKYPDIIYIASCALHNKDVSDNYYEKCMETVRKLALERNVFFVTDFLEPQKSITLLQACDVLVLPYDMIRETASGAVRFCVAAKRPIVTTRQDAFKEFEMCSYQIDHNDPELIAEAVEHMMDPAASQEYLKRVEQRIEETNWHTIVRQYLKLYQESRPDKL